MVALCVERTHDDLDERCDVDVDVEPALIHLVAHHLAGTGAEHAGEVEDHGIDIRVRSRHRADATGHVATTIMATAAAPRAVHATVRIQLVRTSRRWTTASKPVDRRMWSGA